MAIPKQADTLAGVYIMYILDISGQSHPYTPRELGGGGGKCTVPNAAHISEKYLGVYMGASPLADKYLKAV